MDNDFLKDTREMTMTQLATNSDVWLTHIEGWLYDAVSGCEDLVGGDDDDRIYIGVLAFTATSCYGKSGRMQSRAKSKLHTTFELQPEHT
jgi:hypothetical protein